MDEKFVEWLDGREPASIGWTEVGYIKNEDDETYYVRLQNSTDGDTTTWYTNFVDAWTETLTKTQFWSRLKELNPSLEADTTTLTDEVRTVIFDKRRDCKTNVERQQPNEILVVDFRSKFAGLPFRWQCKAKKCPSRQFYALIVRPLLATSIQYKRRETDLYEILAARDQEIEKIRYNRTGDLDADVRVDSKFRRFRSQQWSNDDLRSKEFLHLQRGSQNDADLTRRILSDDVYTTVCRADVYLLHHPEPSTSNETAIEIPSEDNSRKRSPRNKLKTQATTVSALDDVGETSSPPARPQPAHKKQKRLRL